MTALPRRVILTAIVLGLGLSLRAMQAGAARLDGVDITTTHEYTFAQLITFKLDATLDTRVDGARVHVRADQIDVASLPADFTPGTNVVAELSLELRGGVLPPFSVVTYWWELTDENGRTFTSDPVSFQYIDNRYAWQRAERGGVRVFWSDGEGEFGQRVLDTALAALPGIAAEVGVPPPDNIDVYVYPSREDLAGALRLGGRDWAGGQARPELGVVLVDLPPAETAPVEMQRVIPHELTHLLVYAAAQPSYDSLPAWLDEGLATANEVSPDPALAVALQAAAEDDRLFAFETLCAPFPIEGQAALLAYAQSGSLIQFVRNRYGSQGIQSLLAAYRERAECVPGVERALGAPLLAIESQWRAQFGPDNQAVGAAAEAGAPWLVLLLIVGLALLPMLGGLPAAKRRA
jgi:hypothetical protein